MLSQKWVRDVVAYDEAQSITLLQHTHFVYGINTPVCSRREWT